MSETGVPPSGAPPSSPAPPAASAWSSRGCSGPRVGTSSWWPAAAPRWRPSPRRSRSGTVSRSPCSQGPVEAARERRAGGLARGRGVVVDALVNNAGFSTYGEFWLDEPAIAVLDAAGERRRAHRAVAPRRPRHGRRRRGGRVLNLGSVGSFGPAPMTAAYAATKAYVLSLSLAMAEELRDTGVTVTCLCPGPTATGFQARADMAESALVRDRKLPSAREVAEAGYGAMKAGEALPRHRRVQQGVRPGQPVPAADDAGAHRRPLPAARRGLIVCRPNRLVSSTRGRGGACMLKEFKEFALKGT